MENMNNLKKLRQAAGLSQEELADLAGVSQPSIGRLEAGKQNTTLATANLIATALGVPVWYMLADESADVINKLVKGYHQSGPETRMMWSALADSALGNSDKPVE
jgi:transcriptional regulator with XRE-family HTH domain